MLYHQTPNIESLPLHALTGKKVYLKMDCYQPTGSFKVRGMDAIAREMMAAGKTELIASSGGNAGYSLAYVGRHLGIKVTVVVPTSTPEAVQQNIRLQGANVLVHGDVWDKTNEYAVALAAKNPNAAYISPFDHPALWRGHSSIIAECKQQLLAANVTMPDVLIVAVGGGGLLCGVMEGLYKNGWENMQVLAAETTGAASLAAAVAAQKVVSLDKIDSVASSLGAKQVSEVAFQWTQKHATLVPVQVSDEAALTACRRFAKDHRALVEPACGAALAVVYGLEKGTKQTNISPILSAAKSILVIVCGGIGANALTF